MFSSVAFAGSRSLPPSAAPLVASVVRAALAAGARLSAACCVGADQAVVSAALAAGAASRLSLFAAFGPGGVGACSLSSLAGVLAAAAAGVPVLWWAGGGPAVPLRARLARRSAACVSSAAPAGALVLFSPGRGSLAAALPPALRAALPVFVFAPAPPPVLPFAAGAFLGLPCWAWSPQPRLF